MSDIIVFRQEGQQTAYYVDEGAEYRKVPEFTQPIPAQQESPIKTAEMTTEQNYNMIDGCVNNNPKKPRIIGNRISVLDRLHIKLEERKQKSQPQQQQQQERSWKN